MAETDQGLYRSGRRLKDPSGIHGESDSGIAPTKAITAIVASRPPHQTKKNDHQPSPRAALAEYKSSQSWREVAFKSYAMKCLRSLSSIDDVYSWRERQRGTNGLKSLAGPSLPYHPVSYAGVIEEGETQDWFQWLSAGFKALDCGTVES